MVEKYSNVAIQCCLGSTGQYVYQYFLPNWCALPLRKLRYFLDGVTSNHCSCAERSNNFTGLLNEYTDAIVAISLAVHVAECAF